MPFFTQVMVQEIFIGRSQEQKQFRQALRPFQKSWAAKNLPTLMKLMGKAAPQPEKPAIFLFYGEGGDGEDHPGEGIKAD